MNIAPASTSVILIVKIVDDSGLPVTGLVAATFPATYYAKVGAAAVSITLSDLVAINSNYSSGGVKEIGGGRYRLDVPDAAFSASNRMVEVFGEASGKHLVSPQITCQYMQSDVRQWVGKIPAGVYGNSDGGKVQVHDRRIVLENLTPGDFGASTIEFGPGGLGYNDDTFVELIAVVTNSDGVTQARVVTDFVNATGVMTVDRPWDPVPDEFSTLDLRVPDSLSEGERDAIADVSLRRTMANVEASAVGESLSEASLYGLIQRARKSSMVAHAGKHTVYKNDGTTELAQISITEDVDANPITEVGV